MAKNFKLPTLPKGRALPFAALFAALKDPQIIVRVMLGLLLAANIVAAGFAFHFFDDSPQKISSDVLSTRQQVVAQMTKLNTTRLHASKVARGREEGAKFIATYMTHRRSAYSNILSEIDSMAAACAMKSKDEVINFDAIEGTDALDMMTITASFETNYPGLLKFLNMVDRSQRFFIIQSLSAVPQANQNGMIQITIQMNAFVKEDPGA